MSLPPLPDINLLHDMRLFLESLPDDLGRGSLNGMRAQLAYSVHAALAVQGESCSLAPAASSAKPAPCSAADGSERQTTKRYPLDIRLNQDGTLDEVVGSGLFHLEQMDDNHWWMLFTDASGKAVHVNLHARGRIKANFDPEQHEAAKQDRGGEATNTAEGGRP